MADPERSIRVNDPAALRALANPLRLRVLGTLRSDGPQTVGRLSDRFDVAPGSISYHLTTLEQHGFVEPAPELARDGRERWWRATADFTTYQPGELADDPERQVAGTAMRRAVLASYGAEQQAYLDVEPSLPRDWIAAAGSGDTFALLTVEELAELRDELEALAQRWGERRDPDREGVQAVHLIYAAFRRP